MDDYQYQNDGYVETPQDYKIWSIINIVLGVLCCCNCGFVSIIMGILALMKSNEVEKNIQMGEQGASCWHKKHPARLKPITLLHPHLSYSAL